MTDGDHYESKRDIEISWAKVEGKVCRTKSSRGQEEEGSIEWHTKSNVYAIIYFAALSTSIRQRPEEDNFSSF